MGSTHSGPPVIGSETSHSVEEWRNLCEELIGFYPAMSDFDGQRLKLGCLARVLDTELQLMPPVAQGNSGAVDTLPLL